MLTLIKEAAPNAADIEHALHVLALRNRDADPVRRGAPGSVH
jgi:hypothetical protein